MGDTDSTLFDLNPNKDSLILEQTNYNILGNSFSSKYSMLIGCIDGLVCVFHWHKDESKMIEIAVWNPVINHYLVIPPLLKQDIERQDVLLGFGFDSVENDFKVIFGNLIEGQPLEVDVYSCKAGFWKDIGPLDIIYGGEIQRQTEPTIVNGYPFWLNETRNDAEINLAVMLFDVQHEVLELLPSFSCINDSKFKTCDLMNFRDSFAIMDYNRVTFFAEPIDVYTFDHICSVWDKISIGPFICKEPNIKLHRLIPCLRNGDILFVNYDGFILYGVNPETYTIKILKEGAFKECILNCYNYSESLIFIEGMKPVYGKPDEGKFKFLLRESIELARSYEYLSFT